MSGFEIVLSPDKLLRLECARIAHNPTNARELYEFIQQGDNEKPSDEKNERLEIVK